MRAGLVHLIFPLIIIAIVFIAFYSNPEFYYFWSTSNTSVMEATSGLILMTTLAFGLPILFFPEVRGNKVLRWWLVAYLFSVFYFMGEDQNWGQYYFGWKSPQYFLENNKEQETNLHNMSSWFNQKPRFVMEMWIIVCGILVPMGWKWPRKLLDKYVPALLWPDKSFTPLAILTILISLPSRLDRHLHIIIDPAWDNIRFSELQELCFGYYMLIYILMVRDRVKSSSTVN